LTFREGHETKSAACLRTPVWQQDTKVPIGRKVFLAVVLSQLFSIALIFGWYFYALRSELGSLTQHRAQEAVLQSMAATEDYFKPAEMAVEAGQLLLLDHIVGPEKPDPLERYFFWGSFACGHFWRVSISATPQANSSTLCAATRRSKAAPALR
jgi:hypothetical protein